MKQTLISLSVVALFSSGLAQGMGADIVNGTATNNFTMVGAANGVTGGNNTTLFTWDGTYRTAVVTDGTHNAVFSSATKFGGWLWTAHHGNVYAPGTYTFNAGCAAGNPSCGTGPSYTLTVPAGQIGVHMLFDWGSTSSGAGLALCGKANCDIDVVLLWDMNKSWAQTGTTSGFSTIASSTNTINTVWSGVSIDTPIDADNFSGTQMIDGPFIGQSANFNVNGIAAAPAYPLLQTVAPASGATNQPTNTGISITFDVAMDPATVTTSSFTVQNGANPTVCDSISTSDSLTFACVHAAALTPSVTYTVGVTTAVKTIIGLPATAASWSFTTAASIALDTTSPTVSANSRIPTPSAVTQTLQPTIVVTFSEAMDPAVTAGAIRVAKSGGPSVPCAFIPDATNMTFTCQVNSNLDFSSVYQVTVGSDAARTPPNANAAQDLAHNNLIANTNNAWTFTTVAAPDTIPPTITGKSPESAATSVTVTTPVAVTFSEAMNASTANAITLTQAGATIPCLFAANIGNTIFTCTPATPLISNTTYAVSVSTAAQDLAGNSLIAAPANSWSFTTATFGTPGSSAGGKQTCGIKADGNVACWGSSTSTAPPLGTFTQVGNGSNFACGLKFDGSVACWGDNSSGQGVAPLP